jgi:hypothetical protein
MKATRFRREACKPPRELCLKSCELGAQSRNELPLFNAELRGRGLELFAKFHAKVGASFSYNRANSLVEGVSMLLECGVDAPIGPSVPAIPVLAATFDLMGLPLAFGGLASRLGKFRVGVLHGRSPVLACIGERGSHWSISACYPTSTLSFEMALSGTLPVFRPLI